jgi:hypothetical protein
MKNEKRGRFWALTVLSTLVLGGCNQDDEIQTYRVAKPEEPPPVAAEDPHAGVTMPDPGQSDPHAGVTMPQPGEADPHAGLPIGKTATGQPAVEGEVPAGWKRGRGSSLRLASYVAEGDGGTLADISLIVLKGQAGGVLGNINRWRGQIGLDIVDEQGLAESSTKLMTPVGEAVVVDIEAVIAVADRAKDGRIVAAVVPTDGEMWFYKMRGNVELVGREKEGFLRWVSTARKTEVKEPADAPPDAETKVLPKPAAAPTDAETKPQPKPPGAPDWRVPEGWKEMPAKSMRVATFEVGPGGEVVVSKLAGDGGGDLANVNRWRGQVGLESIDEDRLASEVNRIDSGAGTMSCVDCAGEKERMLVAWLRRGGSTWFFKLSGPPALVEGERERFEGFLGSVTFPE